MKRVLLSFVFFLGLFTLVAQDYHTVSIGSGYSSQAFFKLSDGAIESYDVDSWDIGFSAIGGIDGGVFLNEAAASQGSELELYVANTIDFSETITASDVSERLLNDETSWDYGAFNTIRDESDFSDYGWGLYNPQNHVIEGAHVYVLKMRDGTYQKIMIESLTGGVYTLRYADLDGSNEVSLTVDKATAGAAGIVLVSLAEQNVFSPAENGFDLFFTRYSTPIDNGTELQDYVVSGVLSGVDVSVAEAAGVNPDEVMFDDYENQLTTTLDEIGYDWKSIDLTTYMWNIATDRAYFVKTSNNDVYKLIFVDFEGSNTGNAIFTTELVGTVSTTEQTDVAAWGVFPNPVSERLTVSYELNTASDVSMAMFDNLGRVVWSNTTAQSSGFHTLEVDVHTLAKGVYHVQLATPAGVSVVNVIVK